MKLYLKKHLHTTTDGPAIDGYHTLHFPQWTSADHHCSNTGLTATPAAIRTSKLSARAYKPTIFIALKKFNLTGVIVDTIYTQCKDECLFVDLVILSSIRND